jgi:hypothetical protein
LVDRQEGGMNLSRRGFIQAAPAVAAKIAADMGGTLYGGLAGGGMRLANQTTGYPTPDMPSASWAEEEIRRLVRNRAETKAGFEALGDSIRYVEAQRIDGLRSVSGVNKARMAAEAERRRVLAGELKWIDQRLADMKRDYPVLAYLTEALT